MVHLDWQICEDDEEWALSKQNTPDIVPSQTRSSALFLVVVGVACVLSGSIQDVSLPPVAIPVDTDLHLSAPRKIMFDEDWPVWPPEYQQYQNRLEELRQQGYLSGLDWVFYESVDEAE